MKKREIKKIVVRQIQKDFIELIHSFPFQYIIPNHKKLYFILRETRWFGRFPWITSHEILPNSKKNSYKDIIFLLFGLHYLAGVSYFVYKFITFRPYKKYHSKCSLKGLLIVQPTFNIEEYEFNNLSNELGYFGNVKEIIDTKFSKVSVLLIPYLHHKLNSHKKIAEKILQINSEEKYNMTSLGSFFTLNVLIKTIINFSIVSIGSWIYVALKIFFKPNRYSIFKFGLKYSYISGYDLAHNLLIAQLLNCALNEHNKISACIYLCEGQSWELSLNRIIKTKFINTKVAGYIHIPYRPQDTMILNYLIQDRTFKLIHSPDLFFCPGPQTINLLQNMGFVPESLIPVEAARYMGSSTSKLNYDPSVKSLAIIGDIDMNHIYRTLNYLESIAKRSKLTLKVYIQLHPTQSWKDLLWSGTNLEITNLRSVEQELIPIRLAIFGSMTNSYLHLEFIGIPVLFTGSDCQDINDHVDDNKSFFYGENDLEDFYFNGAPLLTGDFRKNLLWLNDDLKYWKAAINNLSFY